MDADGVKQAKGKEYVLTAYNARGEKREVCFTKTGGAVDYYAPGAYIEVQTSKTLVIGVRMVEEKEIPAAALEQIRTHGTKVAE